MQERLALEVKQREIQRELTGKDGLTDEQEDAQESNWSTADKKEPKSRSARTVSSPVKTENAPDVVRSHDAGLNYQVGKC